ncbi:sodium/hydrogen exchanger family domain-containing protein [Rhizoctonia solani AG-1 IA]|uniref:Sodium/hydrogen exchanger family domain-containing protein n=1 Tax=Thanatephorus cucumeris (strain AG1-IA) TaxID=983506 RepID=L8X9G4_THACA|nr:sodium/hydrogen exchanger family domain-containing protein [Rhizoctonia solani AG-1 IA]
MSEAPFALLFGLLIGPYGIGVFDPRGWTTSGGDDSNASGNYLTFELTRLALGFGLFAIGVELPKSYLRDHAKSLTALIVPVMGKSATGPKLGIAPNTKTAWGWFISAGGVLANAIVSGKWAEQNVPEHLRLLIAAESAANDGLAYPFLYVSIKMLTIGTEPIEIAKFVWECVVCEWINGCHLSVLSLCELDQVLLGVALGAFLGWVFRVLLQRAEARGFIDRSSYIGQYLSLTILSLGTTAILGGDDLLAAFAAGSAVSWDGHFNEKSHESEFSSTLEVFFNCACFVYIGAWLPFHALDLEVDPHLGITSNRMLLLFVTILIVRRIPALVALWWTGWLEPDINTLGEALFSGHFGPMGEFCTCADRSPNFHLHKAGRTIKSIAYPHLFSQLSRSLFWDPSSFVSARIKHFVSHTEIIDDDRWYFHPFLLAWHMVPRGVLQSKDQCRSRKALTEFC